MEELCHWWKSGDLNIQINELNEKPEFIDSVMMKSAELKDEFFSVFPLCRERPRIVILWVEWFGRLKWRAIGLEASLLSF